MRSTISVERIPPSYASISIGAEVKKILAGLAGISDLRIESQCIDGALVSFNSTGALSRVQEALIARGIRQVGPDGASDQPPVRTS